MSLIARRGISTPGEELFARRQGHGSAGVHVTVESARRHSAVWGCLAATAEAISSLKLEESRIQRTGGLAGDVSVTRRPPPLFSRPAPNLTWFHWSWQAIWSLAEHGRTYAFIPDVDASGLPTSLVPLPDSDVQWRYDRQTNQWQTFVGGVKEELWPLGRLWHCPLYVLPGYPMGLNPIEYHAESIGIGLAAQKFGATWFEDGGHPTAIVTTDKKPNDASARNFKARMMAAMRGSREPIFVPSGTKLEKWQINPDESQFLNTIQASGTDICRIFGTPPGKIGLAVSGQNVTYSNVSDANADWRVSGLARYVGAFEASLSTLIPNGRNRELVLDFSSFLRASPTDRFATYKIAAEIGQLTGTPIFYPNEMRAKEGQAPVEGGDTIARVVQPVTKEEKDQS